MRRRPLTVLVSMLLLLIGGGAATLATSSSARRTVRHPRPSLASRPDPSTAGDQVMIFGRVLFAPAGTRVVLWHRLPRQRHYTRVVTTTTDGSGFYSIPRGRGVVDTNRRWYVVARGKRSRTLYQRVHALVTLAASPVSVNPGDTVSFSGHIDPSHAFQRIRLEQQVNGGWKLLARALIGRGSNYSLSQKLSTTGTFVFRAVLRGDRRNIRSSSAPITVTVGQSGIHKIKHVVIIMQENRSFDHYFGTYPGADGIPAGVCIPDPLRRRLREAVPRLGGPQLRRSARRSRTRPLTSTAAR